MVKDVKDDKRALAPFSHPHNRLLSEAQYEVDVNGVKSWVLESYRNGATLKRLN